MTLDALPGGATRTVRPIRWIVLSVGFLAVVAFGVVFGLQLGDGVQVAESPLVGKPAPDVRLVDMEGTAFRLSEFAGQPVVLNFWASWCVPCREEAPRLEDFSRRRRSDGVVVIGVVWNDSRSAARAFRRAFDITYPQAFDPDNQAALEYGVRGVPETYLIDPSGVVMAKIVGAVRDRTLDRLLDDALAGRATTERNEEDYRTDVPGER